MLFKKINSLYYLLFSSFIVTFSIFTFHIVLSHDLQYFHHYNATITPNTFATTHFHLPSGFFYYFPYKHTIYVYVLIPSSFQNLQSCCIVFSKSPYFQINALFLQTRTLSTLRHHHMPLLLLMLSYLYVLPFANNLRVLDHNNTFVTCILSS